MLVRREVEGRNGKCGQNVDDAASRHDGEGARLAAELLLAVFPYGLVVLRDQLLDVVRRHDAVDLLLAFDPRGRAS